MGLSGYEVVVLSSVSPFLLGIPAVRRLVTANLRIMHLLALSGLAAFLVSPPDYRLFTVGFGVAMSCLSWAATFVAERSQPHRLEARIMAFGIGLIASSIAKFACWTNNPVWPVMHAENGGWNKLGLALGVLAVLRSTRNPPTTSGEPINLGTKQSSKQGFSAMAACGLGSVFFTMHWLLSDSSTMILWGWNGFPIVGPMAAPHGSLTILAMGIGLMLGVFYPDVVRTWTAFGIGCVGAAILTTSHGWFGFYGALTLATYTMASLPVMVRSAVLHGPAKTFGFGFVLYNFMVLFHIWVTAYAFVPGGPLVREHTDWVMMTNMGLLGAGVFSAIGSAPMSARPTSRTPHPTARRQRSYYAYILASLQLLSISVAYLRFPTFDYTPYHPDSKIITAGIWTIHFYLDNPMWDSTRRMRDLIKEMEVDVIGLLESDTQHIIGGNRDPTQFLAQDLGMYVDFGPGPNKHTWGAALLSRFPIVNSTHHLLPSPVGELAPAIHATIDAYGSLVDVFVFHSGQEEDPEDRRLQSLYLADLMKNSPRPSILLSYLVTKPHEGNYNTYVGEKSGMRDIDPSDNDDRWCEYILYKGIKRSGYARISRDSITDTELQVSTCHIQSSVVDRLYTKNTANNVPQVGKFVVGQPEGTDELISEDQVPQDMRFPSMFRGEGVRGHHYHVFDEPRYFA